MELIRTLGIAIDPSAAKSGSAQAAAAFQRVSQAASAAGAAAQVATKGLGPIGAALGVVKKALSSIDFEGMVTGLYETSTSLEKLQRQLKFASAGSEDFRENFGFLRGVAQELGLEFTSAGEAFAKFATAAKGKLSGAQIRDTFLAVTEASVAMGQGTDHASEALKVLGEMLAKGTLKADDLRGQLDEKLPGAFRLAAESMNVTEEELSSMLDTGDVMAGELLPKLAEKLRETIGPGAAEGARSLQAEMNRLKNTWTEIQAIVMGEGGESIFSHALSLAQDALNKFKSWLAAIFEANKEGRLGEAIAASLQVGIAKGANYFAGFVKTAAEMFGAIAPKLFSADFLRSLLGTFQAIAASFGVGLLEAMKRPLAYLQVGMEMAIEKILPKSVTSLKEESNIIEDLWRNDARFRGRHQSDLGILSYELADEKRKGWRFGPMSVGADPVFKQAVEERVGTLSFNKRLEEKMTSGGPTFWGGQTIDDWKRANQQNLEFNLAGLVRQGVDLTQYLIAGWKNFKPLDVVDASASMKVLRELFQNSQNPWAKPAPELPRFGAPFFSLGPFRNSSPPEPEPPPTPSLFSRFRQGLQQGTEGFTDAVQQMQAAGAETARALTSDFADFFTSSIEGTKSLGAAFRDMAASILRDIERILVHKLIAEPIVGAITHTLGLPTTKSHHGGLVGAGGGMSTLVNPLLFLGAPRLHSGLAPDEFPAILQRGERVVPKSQAGAWDRGGDININVNVDGSRGGTPAQNKAFGAEVARQIEAMVDARIARAAMPRGILRPAASYA